MRPCLRSTPSKNSKKPNHSIRVILSRDFKRLEKDYLSHVVTLTKTGDLIIKAAGGFQSGWGKSLFKISSYEWLRRHLIKYEKMLKNTPTIDMGKFENKYRDYRSDTMNHSMSVFSSLSSPEESLRLTSVGRAQETFHIVSTCWGRTKLFLGSINVRLKKIIRSEVINIGPCLEKESSGGRGIGQHEFKITGMAWNVEKDRAVVCVRDTGECKNTFYRVENLMNQKKRTSEVLFELDLKRKIFYLYGHYFSPDFDFFDGVDIYQEELLSWFGENLQINPKTGRVRDYFLFTRSFEPYIKEVLLGKLPAHLKQSVKKTVPLRDNRMKRLSLLANDKSVFLYKREGDELIWEMPFREEIVKGIMAQSKIANVDHRMAKLNIYGVLDPSGYLGLEKRLDLPKMGLFSSFGGSETNLGYLKLVDFVSLSKKNQYLAIIQQLPIVRETFKFHLEENKYTLVKRFVDSASPDTPESEKFQLFAFLKLTPKLEVVQEWYFGFQSTKESQPQFSEIRW